MECYMTTYKHFLNRALASEKEQFLSLVGGSRKYLLFHVLRHRKPSLALAERIVRATEIIALQNGGMTPRLTVEGLFSEWNERLASRCGGSLE